MQVTTNYSLSKPELSDSANITILNANMDTIDGLIKDINDNKATNTAVGLKADKTNVLQLDNTTSFTPNQDYEPATKKYVDDTAISGIGDGTITDIKMATDVKIGSLAALTTSANTNIVSAINEVEATAEGAIPKSLLTTQGDVIYATGASTPARLAKGTAHQQLGMNAGATAPEWKSSLQSLMTAAGDIVYASSANTPAKLAKGTGLQVLRMNSGATAPEWGDVALNKQIFTTSGTFTAPKTGVYKVTVTGAGGNGASSGNTYGVGGGGGAGGTAIKFITIASGVAKTVTVGTTAGATSSFDTDCSATGGSDGTGGAVNSVNPIGGTGGAGSSGDINIDGGDGDSGNGGASASNVGYRGGSGASSYWGGGGGGGSKHYASAGSSAGTDGKAYGSGGGGSASLNSSSIGGGAFKQGVVVVEWV